MIYFLGSVQVGNLVSTITAILNFSFRRFFKSVAFSRGSYLKDLEFSDGIGVDRF